ncbi:hypothetical protein [Streptomyces phaeochromogenes]|uniref:hypothetical protein n=1 Tax=Streptomyces phaeochromogenes TaxID=1923 RepID=UPI002E1492B2|nr:hypothetical protein OG437_36495 [Streptomyces phaeochromogenes]
MVVLVGALAVIRSRRCRRVRRGPLLHPGRRPLAELAIWVWLCVGAAARSDVTLQQLKPPALKRLFGEHAKAERAKGELVFYAHAAVLCAAAWLMSVRKRLSGSGS